MGDCHFVGHIETADGADLAVVNSHVEVCHLVRAVEALWDVDLGAADLGVVQAALLLETERVVKSRGGDEGALRGDQDALSGAQHALSILVDDEGLVDGDQLRLEEVLQLCHCQVKPSVRHRMLASGQVGGQLDRHGYACGAHWTNVISKRVCHERVLPCQMLSLELVLLGDHMGVLAPRDRHLNPVGRDGLLGVNVNSGYDRLL